MQQQRCARTSLPRRVVEKAYISIPTGALSVSPASAKWPYVECHTSDCFLQVALVSPSAAIIAILAVIPRVLLQCSLVVSCYTLPIIGQWLGPPPLQALLGLILIIEGSGPHDFLKHCIHHASGTTARKYGRKQLSCCPLQLDRILLCWRYVK